MSKEMRRIIRGALVQGLAQGGTNRSQQVTIAAGLKTVESQFIIENNTNCLCLLQVPPRENNKMSGNIPFIPLVDVWSIHEIYLAKEGPHDSTRPTGWEHVYFIGTAR